MAIFSKKDEEAVQTETAVAPKKQTSGSVSKKSILVAPRVSEKSIKLSAQNKYVFKVNAKANKLEVKKSLEAFYGIKIADVNSINVQGKKRNYGRTSGVMSDFKKVVVTLTKDSKKPSFATE